MKHSLLRISIAEAFGTFVIVFLGTGAIVINDTTGGSLTHLGVCLLWGFAVFFAIVTAEKIGEGHFNPAVTIAVALKEKPPVSVVALRIVMQCIGAVAGSFVLSRIFPSDLSLGATLPRLDTWTVFLIEVIISFGLMITIEISVGKALKLSMAASLIGLYVAVAAFIAGPYTGASMNPARSLGPAMVSGMWSSLWVYMLAPPIGMLLAIPFAKRVVHR